MHQSRGKLLFVHWPVPAESLRPLIPEPLAIDTSGGDAWICLTPFTMWDVRPVLTPLFPLLSRSHELNVRTYVHLHGSPAGFEAAWTVGDRMAQPGPDSLDFFLIERYCLYSARRDRICRARIFHNPWPLCGARLVSCRSTMLEARGLPSPEGDPLLHQQREPPRVGIWPRVRVR